MKLKTEYQKALFDCDGVILDSNQVKIDAFRHALVDCPDAIVKEFIDYHRAHGGVSRYEKFDHFFRVMSPSAQVEDDVATALERYAAYLAEALPQAQEVAGVRSYLEDLRAHGVECFVVSGGKETEVREQLEARDLAQYFTLILGSPEIKGNHVNRINQEYILPQNARAVLFGDARLDMEVAETAAMDFVFIAQHSDWDEGEAVCQQRQHLVATNFNEVRGS